MPDPAETEARIPDRVRRQGRRVVIALSALLAAAVLIRGGGHLLPGFIAWIAGQGAWGPAAFIAVYILATAAFVPGSPLTFAAGAIFGIARGTVYVFIGAVVGSGLAFLLARTLARPFIERRIAADPRFQRIDRAVAAEGRRIVFLLRLSPVLPFNLMNGALGMTRVRFRDYLMASVGMIPGTLLYVYSGRVAGDLALLAGGVNIQRGFGSHLVLALGLVATLVATVWLTRIARGALDRETGRDDDSDD